MKKIITILTVLILILIILLCKQCRSLRSQADVIKSKDASITITKNHLNQQIASTKVLQLSNRELRKLNDSMYYKIQRIEREYKRKLFAATSTTIITNDTSTVATNVISSDTIVKDSMIFIYPVYEGIVNKPFARYRVVASKDSTHIETSIINPIDVVYNYKRKNFLGKTDLYIDVKTINPNSGITELKSFHKPERKRYTGIKVAIAFIAGFIVASK